MLDKALKKMSDFSGDGRETAKAGALSDAEVHAAVLRVSASKSFSASPRLQDFLRYVCSQSLDGKADSLRAKTIAYHVYQRDADDPTSANVVRVEARRLRRLLDDYYEDEGRNDPVSITIDKGGYGPRFERRASVTEYPSDTEPASRTQSRKLRHLTLLAVAVGVVTSGIAVWMFWPASDTAPHDVAARLEREALMDQSPAALEAANMANQARGLIWPVFDVERQRIATEMFRTAINSDPNAAGAYSGIAQTLASQALMSIQGERHDAFLAEAQEMSERALDLAPTDAWSQSAAGWVAFVAGDFAEAMRHSERAVSLSPDDGNVLDFYGVVAILTGSPELGVDAGSRERARTGTNTRFANLNILGAALFHTGEYEAAAKAFEDGNASGGPLSAPGVIYLAATYQALDRREDGKRLLTLLEESWPNIPVEAVLRRMHADAAQASDVIDRLVDLGWQNQR